MLQNVKICISSNVDKVYVVDRSWRGLFISVILFLIGKYLVVLLASENKSCAIMSIYMFVPIFIKCM